MKKKKYLVTSALPYANGPLHFGHMAGAYLPADIYVRHMRLSENEVMFICGSDEHGVSIMLNADKQGVDYKEYVDNWSKQHSELFKKYRIDFDYYGQTSEPYHAEEVTKWFHALNEKGLIGTKDSRQLYCSDCKNHLPDRFVHGVCYVCKYEEARGDECPHCGTLIEPEKLIDPVCQICKSKNIKEVTVTQYYLLLSKFHKEYRKWFETNKHWRKTVWPYVDSLTKKELVDRAISRDLNWGIDVPLPEAKGKKLYVWFDAPIGYVSNTKEYLKGQGSSDHYLRDWWKNDDTNIVNFLGKDNIIFHCIIFPVMAMASGIINPPYDVPANQYVNLAGKQFSKSSGWYVDANSALERFGTDALRYYLISLIPETADTSFVWGNFQAKVNNELANNIGNLVNRCFKFLKKNWKDGIDAGFFQGFHESEFGLSLKKKIVEHGILLDQVQIRKGLDMVMSIGHDANNYFSEMAPWAQFKEDENTAAKTMAWTTQYILALGVLLSPYLPDLSGEILSFYSDILTRDQEVELYRGNTEIFDKIFHKGMKVSVKPKALVPKIDDDVIKELEEELAAKT